MGQRLTSALGDAAEPRIQRNWNRSRFAQVRARESRRARRWCPESGSWKSSFETRLKRGQPPRACPAAVSARLRSATPSSTSACRHFARATFPRSGSARWRPSTRSMSVSASTVCWCSSRSSWRRRRSSPNMPTSLRIRTPGLLTRATTWTRWSSASGWGPTARWWRWRATTATCSNISSSAVSPRWGSSPRPTSRRSPASEG